jgi:hypothetical protein
MQFLLLVELVVIKVPTVYVSHLSIGRQKFLPLGARRTDVALYKIGEWCIHFKFSHSFALCITVIEISQC